MDDRGGPVMYFNRGDFDFIAGDGGFLDPRLLTVNGGEVGSIEGSRVVGVYGVLLGYPPYPPYPINPVSVWAVTWRTQDFTPRRVTLDTVNTTVFDVFFEPFPWFRYSLFPDRFTPAHAEIRVDLGLDCYADCDTSTGVGVLDILDFLCFQSRFAVQTVYACGCDTSTGPGVCDIFDFLCFQNEFAAGCP